MYLQIDWRIKLMNLRDSILSATKKRERLDVPAFGGAVWLRELSYAEMKSVQASEGTEPAFQLLALSLCDETGASLLSAKELEQVSNSIIQQLLNKALEVNQLKTALDESKKN